MQFKACSLLLLWFWRHHGTKQNRDQLIETQLDGVTGGLNLKDVKEGLINKLEVIISTRGKL